MYQNYFFDFDGTLYDTYPGMVKAFVEAFALQGVELSPNEVYQVMREASVREAYRRYTTSQLDATKLHADYRNLEEKYQLLSGLVGNLDTVNKNAAYSVYSDDAILDTNPYGRCCFTKRIQDRRHQC